LKKTWLTFFRATYQTIIFSRQGNSICVPASSLPRTLYFWSNDPQSWVSSSPTGDREHLGGLMTKAGHSASSTIYRFNQRWRSYSIQGMDCTQLDRIWWH